MSIPANPTFIRAVSSHICGHDMSMASLLPLLGMWERIRQSIVSVGILMSKGLIKG